MSVYGTWALMNSDLFGQWAYKRGEGIFGLPYARLLYGTIQLRDETPSTTIDVVFGVGRAV